MLYEYKCDDCKIVHEEFRKVAERDNPTACPQCGKETKRIMSRFSHKIKYYKRLYGQRVDEHE